MTITFYGMGKNIFYISEKDPSGTKLHKLLHEGFYRKYTKYNIENKINI